MSRSPETAASPGEYRLGIDIGGTFTDLVLLSETTGQLRFGKILTTPADPSQAILEGAARLLETAGIDPPSVKQVIHATTLVDNAVIEGKGSRTALVTTRGFRDVLSLGREFRYDIYDSSLSFPAAPVPRRDRLEVAERIKADGEVLLPLADSEIDRVIRELTSRGFEAVAICLLNSYRNPRHEEQIAAAIRAADPELAVSISADVLPQLGEYERTCAVVINALAQPLVSAYLGRLRDGFARESLPSDVYCMSATGGLLAASAAARYPIRLLQSGPAAGALGAAYYGQASGQTKLLSLDMGGTTAKACVIRDGAPTVTNEFEVARVQRLTRFSGLPIRLPAIEMLEIGAGGGSIAHIDDLGLINVGPDSAGADPGPACYGLGGDLPTVTDANLVLGYLNPDYFLGGELRLDVAAARAAVAALGARASLSEATAAWGVHEIVSQNMANALRTHAIEKGVDYRDFVLVAFGGAGPVHAYRIASILRIPRVVFPWAAGVFSAFGLLTTPLRFDAVRTLPTDLAGLDAAAIDALYEEMEREVVEVCAEAGVSRADLALSRSGDMRYAGQGMVIEVPLPARALDPAELAEAFTATYRLLYGWTVGGAGIEVVNWRCSARGPSPRPPAVPAGPHLAAEPRRGSRTVYLGDQLGSADCPVYDRYALAPGFTISGPALVEERECTIFVGPGAVASVDDGRNIVMEL